MEFRPPRGGGGGGDVLRKVSFGGLLARVPERWAHRFTRKTCRMPASGQLANSTKP